MNQTKIGVLLQELRKEKGLTQEELARVFNVSNRSVSRWENGNSLPDLDILIEIADFYNVNLRDLLDGKRTISKPNEEIKSTILETVEYSNLSTEKYLKYIKIIFTISTICFVISSITTHTALANIKLLGHIFDFIDGIATGMAVVGLIVVIRYIYRIKSLKKRISGSVK